MNLDTHFPQFGYKEKKLEVVPVEANCTRLFVRVELTAAHWLRNITGSASVYFTLRNDQLSVQKKYTVLIMNLHILAGLKSEQKSLST